MPRTIEIQAYKFDELNETAKQKVLDKFFDLNVDYDWWDNETYQFPEDLETIGAESEGKKFYFDIDSGSFCSFEARITLKDLIGAMDKVTDYSKFPSDLHDVFDYCKTEIGKIRPMLRGLIDNGKINVYCRSSHGRQDLDTFADAEFYGHDATNIEKFTDYWTNELEEVLKMMSNVFLKRLSDSYEYLTSEAAIIESIEANEYEFDEHGKMI